MPKQKEPARLNPCFCGINLLSEIYKLCRNRKNQPVLILVFVEFTLRATRLHGLVSVKRGLNPCFCGIYSQRV